MDVKKLRDLLDGEVTTPDDGAYERARRVWNGMIDRRPAAVVRPTGAADVMAAVRFAREQGSSLAVRGGGHSTSGMSTCDDGIVVDLASMRGVIVDPGARRARVLGGTLLAQLDRETIAHGLVTPSGTVGHTGVGGLTLGGGFGRLTRKHGLSLDNLLAVDIVTADGEQVRASLDDNPELFWGIRGAGPNFGVVTMLEFQLHPMDPITYGAVGVYDIDGAPEVLRAYRSFAPEAPPEMITIASAGVAHAGGPFPPELIGRPVLSVAASYCGSDAAEAERATAVVRTAGKPLFEAFIPAPYTTFQTMSDEAWAWDRRYYVKGGFFEELPDQALDAMLELNAASPSAENEMTLLMIGGGAFGRVPEDAMAFSGRSALYFLDIASKWDDPADDSKQMSWARGAYERMQQHMTRENYVNALDTDPSDPGAEDVVRAAYGDEKYKRLQELKRRWDPDNLFCFNQNIKPA